MPKKRLPPRVKSGKNKGQFRKRAKAKRNPPQKAAARRAPARKAPARKTAARKSGYRPNPARRMKMPDVVGMLTDGTIMAGQVLVGKAAARSAPDLMGFPKEGNVGLAIQAAIAVGIGFVADMFVSAQAGAAILAGGLTAPLETFLVSQDVPWLGEALSPTTSNNAVGAYRRGKGLSRYTPAARNAVPGVGRYTPALMAGVPEEGGLEDGYEVGSGVV